MAVNNNSRLASFQLGGGFGKYRQNLEDKRTPRAEGELAPVEKLNKATSEFLGKGLSKVYSAVTPEEDTLNEIEKNKQIRELQIAQALKGTQFEDYIGQGDLPSAVMQNPVVAQRLKDLGFKRQDFKEGMSRTGQFMYGEQRQAFEKLAAGEELTSQDKLAITLAPLDLFDVIAPGIIAKVSKFGFTKASKIEDVLKDPRLADDLEIQRIGGLLLERPTAPGMPSGQILQKAEDGAGGGSKDTSLSAGRIKFQLASANKTQKKIEDTIQRYIDTGESPPGLNNIKEFSKKQFYDYVDNKYSTTRPFKFSREEAEKVLLKQTKPGVVYGEVSEALKNLENRPNMAELARELGRDKATVQAAVAKWESINGKLKVPKAAFKEQTFITKWARENPDFNLTKTRTPTTTKPGDRSELLLLEGFLRSSNARDFSKTSSMNREEFAEFFMNDFKTKFPNWKKTFAKDLKGIKRLEDQRVFAQRKINDMLKQYKENYPEQFKGVTLEGKGKTMDFTLNVSHDFALRMDDPIPGVGGFVSSMRLNFGKTNVDTQRQIEIKLVNLKRDVESGKTSMEDAREIISKFDKINQRTGSLTNITIKNPEYKNVYEDFEVGAIDKPGVQTIIEAARREFEKIAKGPKPQIQKEGDLQRGFIKRRIPIPRQRGRGAAYQDKLRTKAEGGEIRGYAEGDQVMSEENQEPSSPNNDSMLSKVGNFFIPKAEASTLKPLFKPIFDWMMVGNAPKTVTNIQKSQQKVLAGPPTLEKRYNIISPEGQKVYQSKSMDDADQKALVLGDQEGLTFRVEEIEVPVKVKKKKTGTQLTVTMTPDVVVGSGTNRLYYSKLMQAMNSPTGNLTIKGQNVARDTVALPAKEWQDYFRSIGVRESELQDSYIRQYLNKKGGFNNETQQFTINTPITYDEIADLAGNSPTNFIQSSKYGDYAGNLKYGNSGRYENYINGSREERVLWVDSADIRGDIGGLPRDIRNYEGHSNMRQVTDDIDFDIKNKLAQGGEPYVIGWSLNSNRLGTSATGKKIIVNTADEIQSDFLQKAASLKSQLKKDLQSLTEIETPRPDLLKETQARLQNIFRPMPATAFEIAEQLENLKKANEIFQNVAKMEIDRVNPGIFSSLKTASKLRDEALAAINQKIDDVDMNKMFPNIPLKNQKDWVDALIKNDVYEAARKRFYFDENGALQTNKEAPSHYTVAPSKAVKASNPGVGIKLDPTDPNRSGKAVAYDMQYGGPKAVDHTGAHFTSNSEESLRRIAKMKNSELSIGTVDFGTAGEKVETFLLELTPDMLTPYPTYFKDGGVVQKKNVYNPLLSINDVLRPIGVY